MADFPPQSPTTLTCFAVREEARFFQPSLAAESQIVICVTGIGQQNAAKAVVEQLARLRPNLVLTCGFAGGLNPKLARGTILFSADEESSLSSALLELGAVPARFHCAERIAITVAEKRAIWQSTGADAVEMESGVIRNICRERGVPGATIRVISDAADEDLPFDFNEMLTPNQDMSYARLARALIRSPQKIPALLRLHKHTTSAARRLAECLHALLGS